MSLIPGIHKLLHLTPQRSLNRRSKTGRFYHGQKTEISFIIQRADLFGFNEAELMGKMPWLRDVLRDALGRSGEDVRLGNIRCVSCRNSWWTKEVKKEIWERGGGGWLVGKVNVGKSQLLRDVFPKGRTGLPAPKDHASKPKETSHTQEDEMLKAALASVKGENDITAQVDTVDPKREEEESEWEDTEELLDTSLLLPPAPAEVDFPAMPLVSALPGTTASPIRLPFGNGKGELVDLPGLARSDLETHVLPEHRSSLVMRQPVLAEQKTIKPGQSLLIGGFIRITPLDPDMIFLSHSFTPLKSHVTRTDDKAIPMQLQDRESGLENISIPGTGDKIASAGVYQLKWNVTKERSGPLTLRSGKHLDPRTLPFRVYSTDILIEGVGWVELSAQIRQKPQYGRDRWSGRGYKPRGFGNFQPEEPEEVIFPSVEVFTPGGKYTAQRRPMNASLGGRNKAPTGHRPSRPRKSMKGASKLAKLAVKAVERFPGHN